MGDELLDIIWNEFCQRVNKYLISLTSISANDIKKYYIVNDYSDQLPYDLVTRDITPHKLYVLLNTKDNTECITVFINKNGFEFFP